MTVQELHDHIHDLLQDRDPKAQLDEQRLQTTHVSDASVPAASQQVIAPVAAVSVEEGGEDDTHAPDMSGATTSQEEDQTGTDPTGPETSTELPESSDSHVPGPVAEGDVAVESAPNIDTSAPLQARTGSLNDSVVDDYIQVQNSTLPA